MRLRSLALVLLGLLTASASLRAQATPAATIPGDIQIGAGFSRENPDYGPEKVNGFLVFADADLWKHFGVEAEYHHFTANVQTPITEQTYEVGGRYRYPIRRLSPYAKILIGGANFSFGSGYQNGTYRMYAGGGGLDYQLLEHVVVRADYEYQRWGTFPPRGLQPNIFSVGAAFRFH